MSIEKTEGYNTIRIFVFLMAIAFQIIIYINENQIDNSSLTPYLLSNVSISAGYAVDLFPFKESFKSFKSIVVISWCVIFIQMISIILSLTDIMWISIQSDGINIFQGTVIPIFTIIALISYLIVNALALVCCVKEKDSFIVER